MEKGKLYTLTPRQKKMGKALARKCYKTVAKDCWGNENTRPYLLQLMRKQWCVSSKVCAPAQLIQCSSRP